LLWRLFMSNPEIKPALDAIGFVSDATSVKNAVYTEGSYFSISPNPSLDKTLISIDLQKSEAVNLAISDATGRMVQTVFKDKNLPEGKTEIMVETSDLKSGVYTERSPFFGTT
jgi:Secretion system C-terminal sorting domain